jgi:hypothetical protein
MERVLLDLLNALAAIGNEHEELFDSEVRERMGNAVFHGFVKPVSDFVVPEDLGMFSAEANARVKRALETYIAAARQEAESLGLVTFHQRLAAFQNPLVRTASTPWYDYDEFCGRTNPNCYDENGNVIDPRL